MRPRARRRRRVLSRPHRLPAALSLLSAALALALEVAAAAPVSAQSPPLPPAPSYAPLNPRVRSRSALASEPFRAPPRRGWRWDLSLDYGSAAERDALPTAIYLLDAELLRVEAGAARDLGDGTFVELRAGVSGAYAGFADAFFDGYHSLIRYRQRARAARPRNEFAYLLDVDAGPRVHYGRVGLALDDLRLTVGRRIGAGAQATLVGTVPTSTAPAGYARGRPSAGAALTARLTGGPRGALDASVGAGLTPRHGADRALQRDRFYNLSAVARLRLWGAHAAYGTLFYHSPTHLGSGLPEFDGRELSADFGWMLVRPSGRIWRVGLAEDFGPRDGSIDLVLRAGTSW